MLFRSTGEWWNVGMSEVEVGCVRRNRPSMTDCRLWCVLGRTSAITMLGCWLPGQGMWVSGTQASGVCKYLLVALHSGTCLLRLIIEPNRYTTIFLRCLPTSFVFTRRQFTISQILLLSRKFIYINWNPIYLFISGVPQGSPMRHSFESFGKLWEYRSILIGEDQKFITTTISIHHHIHHAPQKFRYFLWLYDFY